MNLGKFDNGAGRLYDHWSRAKNENGEYITYPRDQGGAEHIDREKTDQNYTIGNIRSKDWVKERLKGVYQKPGQKKPVRACDIVVTLPRSESSDPENVQKFMQAAYDSLERQFGCNDNIIGCWVHVDEAQPHMHFAFLPISERESKQKPEFKEKLSTRAYWPKKSSLQDMHRTTQRDIDEKMGRHVEILNGVTERFGNKTIPELKRETAKLQTKLNHAELLEGNLAKIEASIENAGFFNSDEKKLSTKKLNYLLKAAHAGVQAQVREAELLSRENIMQANNHILEKECDRLHHQNQALTVKNTKLAESLENEKFINAGYREAPDHVRKNVDKYIRDTQESYHAYARDLNRICAYQLAITGDAQNVARQYAGEMADVGVSGSKVTYVKNCLRAAIAQVREMHKEDYTPYDRQPAGGGWTVPNPRQTDYSKPQETTTPALQVVGDGKEIQKDWNMMTVFEKAEAAKKAILRDL